MRHTAAVAVSLLMASAVSCGVLLGLEDRELDTLASTSSTGQGPGPGGYCDSPADCPVAGNACFDRICAAHVCGLIDSPEGAPVESQKEGDCKLVVCDTNGNAVEIPDEEDPFDDGRKCTNDLCDGDKPTHTPAPGPSCGPGLICNVLGACVECVVDDDCPGLGDVCDNFECVPDSCKDGIVNGTETDMDCGGQCNACVDGLSCEEGSDCQSLVCTGSICQVPTCTDLAQNGTESDVDCGGPGCPTCIDGATCGASEDCISGVCGGMVPKTCQVPSCTDAVKNGDEIDIDCGGTVCALGTCDDGEVCEVPEQCQSSVCTGAVCQAPTCSDGVKNGTEENPDCGGPRCPPC